LALLLVLAVGAGCSGSSHSSASTTTSAAVSLDDAARIVASATALLPSDQIRPLLDAFCASARSGDHHWLVDPLVALPLTGTATKDAAWRDEVLGALDKGAQAHCPDDTAKAPDLVSQAYLEIAARTVTTTSSAPPVTASATPTTVATHGSSSSRTTPTTSHTATTSPPTSAAATTSTTAGAGGSSQVGSCSGTGGTNGVSIGNGNSSSCSSSG
jgi:hypothetical protein